MHEKGYGHHGAEGFFQELVIRREGNRSMKDPGGIQGVSGGSFPGEIYHGGTSVQSGDTASERSHIKSIPSATTTHFKNPSSRRKPLP
jgi:hypothetical protein